MIARILLVVGLGLAAGFSASAAMRPADACSCIGSERRVLEVREVSDPDDRELWQGRFVVSERALYPYGGDVLMTLEPQP
jgi:hypothetical protein